MADVWTVHWDSFLMLLYNIPSDGTAVTRHHVLGRRWWIVRRQAEMSVVFVNILCAYTHGTCGCDVDSSVLFLLSGTLAACAQHFGSFSVLRTGSVTGYLMYMLCVWSSMVTDGTIRASCTVNSMVFLSQLISLPSPGGFCSTKSHKWDSASLRML